MEIAGDEMRVVSLSLSVLACVCYSCFSCLPSCVCVREKGKNSYPLFIFLSVYPVLSFCIYFLVSIVHRERALLTKLFPDYSLHSTAYS